MALLLALGERAVRPHADPGLQPERTVLSWGRTVLALDVVALMFLRWYPEVGAASVAPASVAALAGPVVMLRQRRRYADRSAGLVRETVEPAVGRLWRSPGSSWSSPGSVSSPRCAPSADDFQPHGSGISARVVRPVRGP